MPSRRSRLAAPFVVTVAALAGCAEPAPPPPHNNPPPQEQPPREQPHPNPPPPQLADGLPPATNPANVIKRSDGSCEEFTQVNCPKGVLCNPPPPHPVHCP